MRINSYLLNNPTSYNVNVQVILLTVLVNFNPRGHKDAKRQLCSFEIEDLTTDQHISW